MDKQNNKLKILYLKMNIVNSVLYSKNSFTLYIWYQYCYSNGHRASPKKI